MPRKPTLTKRIAKKMQLAKLLNALPKKEILAAGNLEAEVSSLVYDSRKVKAGSLFVAVPGQHTDGHKYLASTAKKNAVVIVGSDAEKLQEFLASEDYKNQTVVRVEDSQAALGKLAAAFYDYPAQKMGVIGVTGTDGKTTTTFLITEMLEQAQINNGLIGTVDHKIGAKRWSHGVHQTTPEAPEIQELLQQMVDAKVEYAILESTSHGLALHRLEDCAFDIAVLTNLTRDHLDFHGTLENYRNAKAILFEQLSKGSIKPFIKFPKTAIINQDDINAPFFVARTLEHAVANGRDVDIMTYAVNSSADVTAKNIKSSASGLEFTAVSPQGDIDLVLKLPGEFNVYNSLAAVCVGLTLGLDLETIKRGLESVKGVSGRMETIEEGQDFAVIVDFAHTPDSLTKVLKVLRPLTSGKLIAVFGAAGERDTTKRPLMGEAAASLADFAIFTNEDPREEDANRILDEIAAGAEKAGWRENENFLKIADRRQALEAAFQRAVAGDTVLLAGKGHEQSIIIGTTETPWDEREQARQALQELLKAQSQ